MNFRKKKEKRFEPYVLEKCVHCGKEKKRKFKSGDFLFLQTSNCQSCSKGKMQIEMVFGEPIVEKS